MNENERRQRDFEAQRQRYRDDRANQQRKEQENRTWERNIARQEQLARQVGVDVLFECPRMIVRTEPTPPFRYTERVCPPLHPGAIAHELKIHSLSLGPFWQNGE